MTSDALTPRPLDHLVLPITSIAAARQRLTQLGFTVAADARHPFGTENACVFFSDKSYLEPLGIADQDICEKEARAGNQFVARDQAFRFRRGAEGFSAIVMGSDNADRDDAGFKTNGISAGDMLQFSRPMKLPDGSEITATFKLSFAADLRSPDFHAITCQRINMPPADRSALEAHANGVKGIKIVVLSEPDPEDFSYFLGEVVNSDTVEVNETGLEITTSNATISVLDPDALTALLGIEAPCHARGLRGRAIIFRVADIAATEKVLKTNNIDFSYKGDMLLVSHEEGQAVIFGFEE